MYSNKENVNILTALLAAHGIRHAVVCPGSRNAPIVHNLHACPQIVCHPVTDERSAGFCALGMALALRQPVTVCVTSGTALLNLAPAVAEAYYQHAPLIVVAADRPPQWIGQLDGQTLPQPDALGRFVAKAVSLPEPRDDEERWYCNRLVNEALLVTDAPVLINVPISEPLFEFTTQQLPTERVIERIPAAITPDAIRRVTERYLSAKRPMLISGQPMNPHYDEAVFLKGDDERYIPDFVLYTGSSIVSKRLKRFLRKADETWAVNTTGEVNDTFRQLTTVIQGDGARVAEHIRQLEAARQHPFTRQWQELLSAIARHADNYTPDYSQMATVQCFERQYTDGHVHYANSTAIRLANIFARHSVYCNRGVNGIEGSLSTAVGHSIVTDERVYCVIGDLSFFYDQNALWNQNLHGNLRILLLNNGRGGIFNLLHGLEQSEARDKLVAAEHSTSARGICQQNDVVYLRAENMEQMREVMHTLLYIESQRPVVLEVFTDASEDERVFRDYYKTLTI